MTAVACTGGLRPSVTPKTKLVRPLKLGEGTKSNDPSRLTVAVPSRGWDTRLAVMLSKLTS